MAVDLKKFPWLLVEGGVLALLGVVALCAPLAAGLAAATVFGWVLIASGSLGLIATFVGENHAHRGWGVGSACVALAVGAVLVIFPLVATEGLILLIGAYLLVDGVVMIGMAFDHRKKAARWGWLMFSGVLDVVLACVLVLLSAVASAAVVGVFVGVDLIVAGAALLLLQWASATSATNVRPAVKAGRSEPLPAPTPKAVNPNV